MMASSDPREPLDADERELAERLARIGPFDGPSTSLDAKILSAAHGASVARKPGRNRHSLRWLGIPPALVTGVGVAAAAVLAFGFVWQMRPQTQVLSAHDESAASEEVFVMAEPARTARAPVANPPPFREEASREQALLDETQPAAAAQSRKSTVVDAVPESPAVASAPAAAADAAAVASHAPAREQSDAEAASPAEAHHADESGFVAEPPAAATPSTAANAAAATESAARKQRNATYTSAARATAERRERAAAMAPPPQAQEAEAKSSAAELDRIEVTGTRSQRNDAAPQKPLAQVAVSDDAALPPTEWLERIRARRDEGDMDGARASLRLFRHEHPRVRIPDDLRALLATLPRQ